MPRVPLVYNKTYSTPRRPYEKERLDQELELIGKFGLRNKREVWRVRYTLAKIRKAARELLTLDEKEPKRLFEGLLNKKIVFKKQKKKSIFLFKVMLYFVVSSELVYLMNLK